MITTLFIALLICIGFMAYLMQTISELELRLHQLELRFDEYILIKEHTITTVPYDPLNPSQIMYDINTQEIKK